MSVLRVALALLAVVVVAEAAAVVPCGAWGSYAQCDSRWGSQRLGTASNTICSAGCAMTSVAMALYKYNTKLYNDIVFPPALNKWLTLNGGYASGELIVWDSVRRLGTLGVYGSYGSLTGAQIRSFIGKCFPVIAWVNNRSHFVMVKGYDSADDNILYINDPARRDTVKYRSQVAKYVVYAPLNKMSPQDPDMPVSNFVPGVYNETQLFPAILPDDLQVPVDFMFETA